MGLAHATGRVTARRRAAVSFRFQPAGDRRRLRPADHGQHRGQAEVTPAGDLHRDNGQVGIAERFSHWTPSASSWLRSQIPLWLSGLVRRRSRATSEAPQFDRLDRAAQRAFDRVLSEHMARHPEGFPTKWQNLLDDGAFDDLYDNASEVVATRVYASLREAAPPLAKVLRRDEQRLAKRMRQVWGRADVAFQANNYIGYELGAHVARSSKQHGPKMLALLGAHGRALRTASEVRQLAMCGFHAGATARWRSLHELSVLMCVLNKADAEVSERYLAYARIEQFRDLEHFQRHAEALNRKPFGPDDVERIERQAAETVERWGPEMSKENGWALPLFPNQKRVTFVDLESLAGLSHLRPFYRLGNNHIHSGARASELNLTDLTPRGTPAITVGSSVFGDIAETCHGAMISVHQATAALVSAYLNELPDGGLDLLVGMKAQSRFVNESAELWGEAADRARARGWFTHGQTTRWRTSGKYAGRALTSLAAQCASIRRAPAPQKAGRRP